MANMSYCRFQNTQKDLDDCLTAMIEEEGENLDGYESRARTQMFEEFIGFLVNNGVEIDSDSLEAFNKRFNLEMML